MQVELKMDEVKIPLGNNGFVLRISTPAGKHIGDLRIGRATVTWRKTRWRNSASMPLSKLIEMLDAVHEEQQE